MDVPDFYRGRCLSDGIRYRQRGPDDFHAVSETQLTKRLEVDLSRRETWVGSKEILHSGGANMTSIRAGPCPDVLKAVARPSRNEYKGLRRYALNRIFELEAELPLNDIPRLVRVEMQVQGRTLTGLHRILRRGRTTLTYRLPWL